MVKWNYYSKQFIRQKFTSNTFTNDKFVQLTICYAIIQLGPNQHENQVDECSQAN